MLREVALTVALVLGSALPGATEEQFDQRSLQKSGGSGEVQGDTNLGRNGISRTDDIRRTATGELRISDAQQRQIREAVSKAKLTHKDDVAFTVSVGAAVPRQAGAMDLPKQISEAAGTEAPLKYLLHRERLILIDEKTQRIVAVIPDVK